MALGITRACPRQRNHAQHQTRTMLIHLNFNFASNYQLSLLPCPHCPQANRIRELNCTGYDHTPTSQRPPPQQHLASSASA